MDYLKQFLFFIMLLFVNFISLILWKLTETKLNIRATNQKIDAIYLKIAHLIEDKLKKEEQ